MTRKRKVKKMRNSINDGMSKIIIRSYNRHCMRSLNKVIVRKNRETLPIDMELSLKKNGKTQILTKKVFQEMLEARFNKLSFEIFGKAL